MADVNAPTPDGSFKAGEINTGCITARASGGLLHIYESVHEDEPETHIALELDEARMLRAFLDVVIP